MKKNQIFIMLLILFLIVSNEAISKPFSKKMTFRVAHNGGNCGECVWIDATGTITPETPRDFKTFINLKDPEGIHIALNSSGGNLLAGIELGRMIRELNRSTVVAKTVYEDRHGRKEATMDKGICISSCAYAFLGGIERSLWPKGFAKSPDLEGKLGFHQYQNNNFEGANLTPNQRAALNDRILSAGQILSGIIVGYTIDMGVNPRLYAIASETEASEIRYFEKSELEQLNVITNASFGEWLIVPHNDGLYISIPENNVNTLPHQVAFYCRKKDQKEIMLVVSGYLFKRTPQLDLNNKELGVIAVELAGTFRGPSLFFDNVKTRLPVEKMEKVSGFTIKKRKFGSNEPSFDYYQIELGDKDLDKLYSSNLFEVDLNTSGAEGYHHIELSLSSKRKKMLRLAWKNCL